MTQGEMLICLYDESIKHLTKAKIYGTNKEYEKFSEEIDRVKEIITFLDHVLDRKIEISMSLTKLYDYFNYELSRISAGRKVELIDELIPLITELRDTWKQADKLSRTQGA
ncbi:MAG: flagellar protein FliS [Oscillospiraceae bacterium]|nr:flagellar protein FliS [Oscillospiraceae bacterium]